MTIGNMASWFSAMITEENGPSIEQRYFKVSIKIAVVVTIFVVGIVAGAAAWAQNMTNHQANVDVTLVRIEKALDQVQGITLLIERVSVQQERIGSMEGRLSRMEDWRLRETGQR